VSSCVHYIGCRYGGREYNPYETYQVEVHSGVPLKAARRRFIDFLRHYRPRDMSEALGLGLGQRHALWVYPWDAGDPREWQRHGWHKRMEECPDILTHYCELGISSVRIDEEFVWLERIMRSFVDNGYKPRSHAPARALELQRAAGDSAYLLLDGNHRAGALTALSLSPTILVRKISCVREDEAGSWNAVRKGWMSREDALKIFHAYFRGEPVWPRSTVPAAIIGTPAWENLYLQ